MSAVRAVALKSKVRVLPISNRRKSVVAKKKAKVIKLPIRRRKIKTLTDLERENLVLDHRAKARKLARSILRKWRARLDLEEVDSVVDLSLCEAVRRFNPNKGASFMTFLYYHLRGNLIRAVSSAANANSIPLPDAESHDSHGDGGVHVTNAVEVAQALCSNDIPLPDETLFRKEVVGLSHEACEKLDELEKEVISGVFLEERQLMDVAKSLGYSRCHISRVKRKALEVLFRELTHAGLEGVQLPAEEEEQENTPRIGLARRAAVRRRILNASRLETQGNLALAQAAC